VESDPQLTHFQRLVPELVAEVEPQGSATLMKMDDLSQCLGRESASGSGRQGVAGAERGGPVAWHPLESHEGVPKVLWDVDGISGAGALTAPSGRTIRGREPAPDPLGPGASSVVFACDNYLPRARPVGGQPVPTRRHGFEVQRRAG
jgi:hypothetical protein